MSEFAVMPLEDYKKACDSVRAKTGKTELIPSGQLSAEIDGIVSDAYKKLLWSKILPDGEIRKFQPSTFYCSASFWTANTFAPDKNIIPSRESLRFFENMSNTEDGTLDLVEYCKTAGIVIDLSNMTKFAYLYNNNKLFSHIGIVDMTNAVNWHYCFQNCTNLHTIDEIIVPDYIFENNNNPFGACISLRHMKVSGTIACDIDLSATMLDGESLVTVCLALKMYMGTEHEFFFTMYLTNTHWLILDGMGTAPDGNSWRDYVASKGWNT